MRLTDKTGSYSFNGIKPGASYSLSVFTDKTAAARKFDEYRTYVWSPEERQVHIARKTDRVEVAPFIGKFNFSNFQRAIELSAADFPELSQVNLSASPVFLKVSYTLRDAVDTPPESIFLGQITDPTQLQVVASIPLAVTAIDYEVFSANYSVSGRIDLGGA
jgi:hypothetical protein